jgi:hypothetical protein
MSGVRRSFGRAHRLLGARHASAPPLKEHQAAVDRTLALVARIATRLPDREQLAYYVALAAACARSAEGLTAEGAEDTEEAQ